MKEVVLQRDNYYKSIPLAYIDPQAFSLFDYNVDDIAQNEIISAVICSLHPIEQCTYATSPLYISRIIPQPNNQFMVLLTDGFNVETRNIQISNQPLPPQHQVVIRPLQDLEQSQINKLFRITDSQDHQSFVGIIHNYIIHLEDRCKRDREKFLTSKKGENVVVPTLPVQPTLPITTPTSDDDLELAYHYYRPARVTVQTLTEALQEHRKKLQEMTAQQFSSLSLQVKQIPHLQENLRLRAYARHINSNIQQAINTKVIACIKSSDLTERIEQLDPLLIQKFRDAKAKTQALNYYKSLLIHALYKAASLYYIHLQKNSDTERNKIVASVNRYFKGIVTISSSGILHPLDYNLSINQSLDDLAVFTSELLRSCDTSLVGNSDKSLSLKQAFSEIPLIDGKPLFEFQLNKPYTFKWCDQAYLLQQTIEKNKSVTEQIIREISHPNELLLKQEAEKVSSECQEIIDENTELLNDYTDKLNSALELISSLKRAITAAVQIKRDIENITIRFPLLHVTTTPSLETVSSSLEQVTNTCNDLNKQFTNPPLSTYDNAAALIKPMSTARQLSKKLETIHSNLSLLLKDYQAAEQEQLRKQQLEEEQKRFKAEQQRLKKEREADVKTPYREQSQTTSLQQAPQQTQESPRPIRHIEPQSRSEPITLPIDDTIPLIQPAAKSKPGFLSRHGGKLFGGIGGVVAGAIGGGVAGAFLAPFTLGISILVGALIGAASVGIFGLLAGTIVDNCCCRPNTLDEAPEDHNAPTASINTTGIYNRLDAEPSRRPAASKTIVVKPPTEHAPNKAPHGQRPHYTNTAATTLIQQMKY